MRIWLERLDASEARLDSSLGAAQRPSEGREAWTAFIDDVLITIQSVERRLSTAGSPSVAGGKDFSETFARFPAELRSIYREGRDQVRELPVDDWQTFNAAAADLSSSLSARAAKAVQRLQSSIPSGRALNVAFGREPACARAEDAADLLQENRRERTLSLIQDDFSAPDCDRQWQTARSSSRAAKLDCTDGDFRITLHDPRYYQQAVVNLISPQDGVSVEVIASPRGRGNVYFGVACLSSGQTGFVFYLSSKDRYSILKRTRANGPPKTIEKGRLSSPEQ